MCLSSTIDLALLQCAATITSRLLLGAQVWFISEMLMIWDEIQGSFPNHPRLKEVSMIVSVFKAYHLSILFLLGLCFESIRFDCATLGLLSILTTCPLSTLSRAYRRQYTGTSLGTFLVAVMTRIGVVLVAILVPWLVEKGNHPVASSLDCIWTFLGPCVAAFHWWKIAVGIYELELGGPKIPQEKLLYYLSIAL
jgi:hypothetical protein